jgi:Holliday junction resolvasome RuvABC endonuclease subunit
MILSLDYGVNSPCLCVRKESSFDFYFFSQRKKHIGFTHSTKDKNSNDFNFHNLNYPKYNTREERYDTVANMLMEIINRESENINLKDINIFVEGYSLGSKGRGVSLLFECGAVIRNKIYNNGLIYTEINPMTLKKNYTGKGTSNKNAMYEYFKEYTGLDLFSIFNLKQGNIIPKPLEDIVDSHALSVFQDQKNATLNKSNKEQRLSKRSRIVGNLLKRLQKVDNTKIHDKMH